MKTVECYRTTIGGIVILLEQLGVDRFRVTYGKEVHEGEYCHAALKLGAAIMHALACSGQLDNRTRSPRAAPATRRHYHRADWVQ